MVRGLLVVFVAVGAQIDGIDGIAENAKNRESVVPLVGWMVVHRVRRDDAIFA